MTEQSTLERVENRLRGKYFGDNEIEIIMEAVETELTGDSDRNPDNLIVAESGTSPEDWRQR